MDRGELRRDQLRRWNIIEADHRKIFRHAQRMAQRGLNHTNGQPIARCQDGSRTRFDFTNAVEGVSTAFFGGAVAFPNDRRKPGPALVEHVKIAFNPPSRYFEADLFYTLSSEKTA